MTIPSAPSRSCRTIRITARSKRVSRIAGVAIRSWPLSENGAGASAGPGGAANRAAGAARRASIRYRAAIHDMGRSVKVTRTANPRAQYQHRVASARPRCRLLVKHRNLGVAHDQFVGTKDWIDTALAL